MASPHQSAPTHICRGQELLHGGREVASQLTDTDGRENCMKIFCYNFTEDLHLWLSPEDAIQIQTTLYFNQNQIKAPYLSLKQPNSQQGLLRMNLPPLQVPLPAGSSTLAWDLLAIPLRHQQVPTYCA